MTRKNQMILPAAATQPHQLSMIQLTAATPIPLQLTAMAQMIVAIQAHQLEMILLAVVILTQPHQLLMIRLVAATPKKQTTRPSVRSVYAVIMFV